MFKRTSQGAAVAASVSLALLVAVGSAKANITWGSNTGLVAMDNTRIASAQAFNQLNPIVINENGSIPKLTTTTQIAACLVNNANGSQRVVLMLRYQDGSVYSIVNSDARLAELAASSSNTINMTNKFSIVTPYGGTPTLKQQITLNGVSTTITWGTSTSIVNAFKKTDGTVIAPNFGGFALTESLDAEAK